METGIWRNNELFQQFWFYLRKTSQYYKQKPSIPFFLCLFLYLRQFFSFLILFVSLHKLFKLWSYYPLFWKVLKLILLINIIENDSPIENKSQGRILLRHFYLWRAKPKHLKAANRIANGKHNIPSSLQYRQERYVKVIAFIQKESN